MIFYLIYWIPGSARDSFASRLRLWACAKSGANIGQGCVFLNFSEIHHISNFSIGNNSGIGIRCIVNCQDKVTIGERVLIGPEVLIFTANHVWNEKLNTYFEQGTNTKPVIIHDNVWLGARSIILPGITIGKGATIAAGAIVTKNVPDYAVVSGVPARVMQIKKHA